MDTKKKYLKKFKRKKLSNGRIQYRPLFEDFYGQANNENGVFYADDPNYKEYNNEENASHKDHHANAIVAEKTGHERYEPVAVTDRLDPELKRGYSALGWPFEDEADIDVRLTPDMFAGETRGNPLADNYLIEHYKKSPLKFTKDINDKNTTIYRLAQGPNSRAVISNPYDEIDAIDFNNVPNMDMESLVWQMAEDLNDYGDESYTNLVNSVFNRPAKYKKGLVIADYPELTEHALALMETTDPITLTDIKKNKYDSQRDSTLESQSKNMKFLNQIPWEDMGQRVKPVGYQNFIAKMLDLIRKDAKALAEGSDQVTKDDINEKLYRAMLKEHMTESLLRFNSQRKRMDLDKLLGPMRKASNKFNDHNVEFETKADLYNILQHGLTPFLSTRAVQNARGPKMMPNKLAQYLMENPFIVPWIPNMFGLINKHYSPTDKENSDERLKNIRSLCSGGREKSKISKNIFKGVKKI